MNEKTLNANKLFANKSIECSVENCAYHCTGDKYCALDKITVAPNTPNPKEVAQTDCYNFRAVN
ncbi:MAG: DUF1540 domain-containing protein [Oscillospiraceae bacterium]|jgi:hypothetical protein|nr:DUF1540 domain-containing protein [Oscillospiraceae bacterium]